MNKRIILISLIFFGCGHPSEKSNEGWKTIEVGDYKFDFPRDFELVEEKGIDSYVGRIQGDSMSFVFDFGYYSNDFGQTRQEYLDKGNWRLFLPSQFMKAGTTYDQTNIPKVDVLSIRPATIRDSTLGKGCDYVAKCKHDNTEFEIAVYIPDEIDQINYTIDTIGNQYRKIVIPKDPQNGTTGIYLRNLKSFNESINGFLALSMATDKLTKQQQETALKIFKTGRQKIETK